MGNIFQTIDEKICRWIDKQHMFFVATAPLGSEGHVNLSPKGHDTLRVLDGNTMAFLDYGGSGVETIAHLRENSRITIMMCAFEGPTKIYRFQGKGEVVTPLDEGFEQLSALFGEKEMGVRAIIRIHVTRISDSCGFGVPLYQYQQQRRVSPDYVKKHGVEAIREYIWDNNEVSIDGLPGVTEEEAAAYEGPSKV
jgi:hypothetical protein